MLTTADAIRDAYSTRDTAERYIDQRFTSAWGSVLHATQVRVVNDAIRRHRVRRVLEIAPGPARLSCEIQGFEHGYLCDASAAMLQVARKRLAIGRRAARPATPWHLVQGDAFHLPAHAPLDLVCSFRLIRHFGADERAALYRQVRSVLKPAGLFVFDAVNITTALPYRLEDESQRAIYDELFRRVDLIEELKTNGFAPLTLTPVIRHMAVQQWVQLMIAPRWFWLARSLIGLLDRVPGEPLEWIVTCRKILGSARRSDQRCIHG